MTDEEVRFCNFEVSTCINAKVDTVQTDPQIIETKYDFWNYPTEINMRTENF